MDKLIALTNKMKQHGWTYDDSKLNIHEFVMSDNEKAARTYFKDLIFNKFGRTSYNAKNVHQYMEEQFNEETSYN
jgi:hypothetical protein